MSNKIPASELEKKTFELMRKFDSCNEMFRLIEICVLKKQDISKNTNDEIEEDEEAEDVVREYVHYKFYECLRKY
jgi:hypothetical protein